MEQKSGGEKGAKGLQLTRRQLLAGTTAAYLGAGALAAVLARKVTFRRPRAGRAAFDLNGRPGWTIDTAHFDGRAHLAVEEGADRLRIALTGARYPGTLLPADFEAEILPGAAGEPLTADGNYAGARMNLALALGNLVLRDLPLGAWLAGDAAPGAPVRLSAEAPLVGDCSLALAGAARATFAPDWSLRLQGAGVAALTAAGRTLLGDELAVQLLPRKAAQLVVTRGRQEWPAVLPPEGSARGSLTAGRNPFSQAVMAFAAAAPAQLTLKGEGRPGLYFSPGGGLTAAGGDPLRFPLQNPAYTVTYAGDSTRHELVADYADEPVWVQARGAVLQLGRTAQTPPFAWHAEGEQTTAVDFRPALLAVAAETMNGLIVQPTVVDPASAVSLPKEGPGLAVNLQSLEVIRPDDLLTLTFKFDDMELLVSDERMPYLHPTKPTARITVTFPPQHIAEEAVPVFDVSVPPRPEPVPPIASRAAGPSHLTFETSDDVDFTLESLLRWDKFTVPEGGNGTLEAPYKLYYHLPAATAWAHSTGPVTGGKWTELWHTRSAETLHMSATTNTNYGKMGAPAFETSPSPFDRANLQTQSATDPVAVDGLILSSLGAWMKANGEWGDDNTIKSYFHHMAMGRDIKVVVIYPGHLMPFGHKASLIVVTERKFRKGRAYLHRKKFIVVREPVKLYGLDGSPNGEREFPFRSVEIRSRVTPPLDSAKVEDGYFWVRVAGTEYPFQAAGTDWQGQTAEFTAKLLFVGNKNGDADNSDNVDAATAAYRAADALLRQIDLQGQSVAYAQPAPDQAAGLTTAKDHTTALDTGTMEFDVGPYSGTWPFFRPKLAFAMVRVPALEQFVAQGKRVKITFHSLYIANAFMDPNKWEVFALLADEWLADMPASTAGGVATPEIRFKALSRKFGAIGLNPVTGSEAYSPMSYFGAAAKVIGALKFADLLRDQSVDAINEAMEKGKKIIPTFVVRLEANMDEVEDEDKEYNDQNRIVKWTKATQLRVGLDLDIAGAVGVQDIPNFLDVNYRKESDRQTALRLSASVMRILKAYPTPPHVLALLKKAGRTDPGPQQLKKWHYQVTGSLEWFALSLYFLKVYFRQIGFVYDSSATKKLAPLIKLDPEKAFIPEGPLTFLSMFMSKHPNEVAGSSPPNADENALILSLGVRIPDFSSPPVPPVGQAPVPRWEIANVEPWFKIKFYLDGKPIRFGMGISYPYAPFKVIYWLKPEFGLIGMGYFAIEFEPGRVRAVQVQLEAGAIFSIEKTLKIGILKGEVVTTVGFYFELTLDDQNRTSYEVTGFLRIVGTVGIKIFEVSIEIYLALTYKAPADAADYWLGTARITIRIKLWLFSFSWSYSYTQRLAGSKQDSTTSQARLEAERPVAAAQPVTARNVAAYCSAFCHSYAEGQVS